MSAIRFADVLAAVPQQEPFRFVDEILELDEEHVVAAYRFRHDHDFYRGHFPGRPVTPGVILIEAMAQAALVTHSLYLGAATGGLTDARRALCVFTDVSVEFASIVAPGTRVVTTGRKLFFRRRKLRSEVRMEREDGALVCSGTMSGMAVPS